MNRRLLLCAAAFMAPLLIGSAGAQAADKIKVATSFSVLGDMVKQIGGDRVEVTSFVGPWCGSLRSILTREKKPAKW